MVTSSERRLYRAMEARCGGGDQGICTRASSVQDQEAQRLLSVHRYEVEGVCLRASGRQTECRRDARMERPDEQMAKGRAEARFFAVWMEDGDKRASDEQGRARGHLPLLRREQPPPKVLRAQTKGTLASIRHHTRTRRCAGV